VTFGQEGVNLDNLSQDTNFQMDIHDLLGLLHNKASSTMSLSEIIED
jgi:hypothetical protein